MTRKGALLSAPLLVALALTSCGGGEYTVVVRFESEALADRVDRVEVFLLDECAGLDATGAAPSSPLQRLDLRRGAMATSFSAVVAGSYVLYARAFDGATCQVIGAGCDAVTLEAGGEGELVVTVGPINGPLCPPGTPCADGVCGVMDAAVMDGGTDAPMDTALPCSCVDCASCDDAGACIADNDLCGAGMYCDLLGGCTTGEPCTTDAECTADGNPCTTISCDVGRGICVPNAAMDGTACVDTVGVDGQCRASACCTGCWDGGACVAGDSVGACGARGERCAGCDDANVCTDDACTSGSCSTSPVSGACPGGMCADGACCTGCLSSAGCEPGSADAACGSAGEACVACDTSACPPRRCVRASACMPLGATAVDARREQVFAIAPDGTLWAWGENDMSELGLGDTTPRDVPTQVGTDADWAQASGGQQHGCGVKTGGQLFCWGTGARTGRLGLGGTDVSRTPSRVGSESDWAMVTCGTRHTCAIKTDGTLWCWGDDEDGRVGVGLGGTVTTPTRVGSASNWTSVDSRSDHTCAISTSGGLFCWGENSLGQLGIGGTGDASEPTPVGTDTDWMQVVAGGSAAGGGGWTCALKSDGSRYCWGLNGLLRRYGDPRTNNSQRRPTRIDAGPWLSLAVGSTHGCAIAMDRSLWCWGDNGDLATGQTMNPVAEPMQVGSDTNFTSVAAGSDDTCAVQSTGAVLCFGRNDSGQLGDGSGMDSRNPVRACL